MCGRLYPRDKPSLPLFDLCTSQAYAKEIREGCIRGYAQSAKRWLLQAEKYSKNHTAVQLRPADVGDADDGEGGEEKGADGDGGVGGGLTKSGRVVRGPWLMLCLHIRRVVFS